MSDLPFQMRSCDFEDNRLSNLKELLMGRIITKVGLADYEDDESYISGGLLLILDNGTKLFVYNMENGNPGGLLVNGIMIEDIVKNV